MNRLSFMAIFAAAGVWSVLTIGAIGGASGEATAAEPSAYGAILPNGAHQVGKDRYQSPSGFGETVKFYSKVYSLEHYPRKAIADLPGVRAVHLVNTGRGEWEGLNIYELNGSTRIFVLPKAAKRSFSR